MTKPKSKFLVGQVVALKQFSTCVRKIARIWWCDTGLGRRKGFVYDFTNGASDWESSLRPLTKLERGK